MNNTHKLFALIAADRVMENAVKAYAGASLGATSVITVPDKRLAAFTCGFLLHINTRTKTTGLVELVGETDLSKISIRWAGDEDDTSYLVNFSNVAEEVRGMCSDEEALNSLTEEPTLITDLIMEVL